MSAAVTDKHIKQTNRILGYEEDRIIPEHRCTLRDVAQAIADAEERGRENAKAELCSSTFGTKGCALRSGHSCAHTSMSGSCWNMAAVP